MWSFNPNEMLNTLKEMAYGPTPKPMCEAQDFLCEWSKGEYHLKDVPMNIVNIPVSSNFLKSMLIGGVVRGARLNEVSPHVINGCFWLYKLSKIIMKAQVSAEAAGISAHHLTFSIAGTLTGYPMLSLMTAFGLDLAYKGYFHPEQCPAAVADFLVGYLGYKAGDQLTNYLFEDISEQTKKPSKKISQN